MRDLILNLSPYLLRYRLMMDGVDYHFTAAVVTTFTIHYMSFSMSANFFVRHTLCVKITSAGEAYRMNLRNLLVPSRADDIDYPVPFLLLVDDFYLIIYRIRILHIVCIAPCMGMCLRLVRGLCFTLIRILRCLRCCRYTRFRCLNYNPLITIHSECST